MWKKEENIPTFDSFFFRLQGARLYFTETDKDSIVIASMTVLKVLDEYDLDEPKCF